MWRYLCCGAREEKKRKPEVEEEEKVSLSLAFKEKGCKNFPHLPTHTNKFTHKNKPITPPTLSPFTATANNAAIMASTTQLMPLSPLRGMSSQMGKISLRAERGDGDSIDVGPQLEKDEQQAKPIFEFEKSVSQKKNIYSTEPIPLNNPWTFWVDRTTRGLNMEEYEKNLKKIYTVFTVQRFWLVYYNIPKPSDLQPRSSLHMMRDDRKPVWEADYNCRGGSYRIRVQKKDTNKVWRELLMAAIGEQLNEYANPNDEICGISVSLRDKEDVLSIWNTNAEKAADARIFECVHMLSPDIVFLSTFYKPHFTHHAFDKTRKGVSHNTKFEVNQFV